MLGIYIYLQLLPPFGYLRGVAISEVLHPWEGTSCAVRKGSEDGWFFGFRFSERGGFRAGVCAGSVVNVSPHLRWSGREVGDGEMLGRCWDAGACSGGQGWFGGRVVQLPWPSSKVFDGLVNPCKVFGTSSPPPLLLLLLLLMLLYYTIRRIIQSSLLARYALCVFNCILSSGMLCGMGLGCDIYAEGYIDFRVRATCLTCICIIVEARMWS